MHTQPGTNRHGHQHLHIRTTCGRLISVGLLALGDSRHPAERISLHIGPAPGTGDGTWAGLTAREARNLAAVLLAQSAVAERAAGSAHHLGDG
jgi:hypothetical protein